MLEVQDVAEEKYSWPEKDTPDVYKKASPPHLATLLSSSPAM